jgi:integrase
MNPFPIPSQPRWPWPLQLDTYDRSPTLSKTERETLAWLFAPSEHAHPLRRHSHAAHALERLLHPIEDALAYLHAHENGACRARRVLLLEMDHRATAFWGWTLEAWCETLAPTRETFVQRHGWAYLDAHDGRPQLVALAYLLCPDLPLAPLLSHLQCFALARSVFGEERIREAVQRIRAILHSWGYEQHDQMDLLSCVSYLFLANRSPFLEDITSSVLEQVAQSCPLHNVQHAWFRVSRALTGLGLITRALPKPDAGKAKTLGTDEQVAQEWRTWCDRWREHCPLQQQTKIGRYYQILKAGRWLKATHPEVTSPAQWSSELAAEFVAAVGDMRVGDWVSSGYHAFLAHDHIGKPLAPAARVSLIVAMRCFVRDCQDWGWIPFRLNVARALKPPRSLRNLMGPNPRVVARAFWAKILWAAMNLAREDLPLPGSSNEQPAYPIEMVRALAVVWCFAALRADEIRRLRLGCIRGPHEEVMVAETGELLPRDAICFLDVPVNKTSTAYTKPVHPLVGKRIAEWERLRPQEQPRALDQKTGEPVQFLFSYRGKRISGDFINGSLIPTLCRKAGVPLEDSRGKITSHRARATIASQLYNAREPLSIFELKEYLGHKHLSSTQHYLKVDPTKLATQVAKAGYFEQNMATIEVLLDQDAVLSGGAASGEPWKYYDLGHGYCTNTFWAECKHRMACARCPFYRPKTGSMEQLVEGKANLVRMLEFVSLTEDEQLLISEGIDLHQALIEKLVDVPTPAGPTPRELAAQQQGERKIIPIKTVRRSKIKKHEES